MGMGVTQRVTAHGYFCLPVANPSCSLATRQLGAFKAGLLNFRNETVLTFGNIALPQMLSRILDD